MSKKIEKIVVVGGGSAGWMSAATISTLVPEIEVSVIESPDFPIIGVGENTIGGIKKWTSTIGLNELDFLKKTDGIYKLSIKFTDFEGKGTGSFHYPFGISTPFTENVKPSDWYLLYNLRQGSLDKNSYARSFYPITAVAEKNRLSVDSTGKTPGFSFNVDAAYHFDAVAFGQYLKNNICLPRGVKLIQSTVDGVVTNDNGVDYLKLTDGSTVTADLFVDCTGFKSLLLGDALREPFVSWSDIIPNNKSWAARVPYKNKKKQMEPFTHCTALKNGWVWNVPLWSRIGTGYVYSDKFTTPEDALIEFKDHIKTNCGVDPEVLNYKSIDLKIGKYKNIWQKNVIGIGLAAGFIEPLESTGLFATYEFLLPFVGTLRRNGVVNQWDRDTYNFTTNQIFTQMADFVALHYAISPRRDTDYWMDITERKRIDTDYAGLIGRNEFEATAMSRHMIKEWTTHSGFQCIAAGMNYSPIDDIVEYNYNKLRGVDTDSYLDYLENIFNECQKNYHAYAMTCPSIYDYMDKHVYRESESKGFK